jgi:hypothetical protein
VKSASGLQTGRTAPRPWPTVKPGLADLTATFAYARLLRMARDRTARRPILVFRRITRRLGPHLSDECGAGESEG